VTRRGVSGSPSRGKTVRIGITGPIGCGKSTVAGWLAGTGAAVVDADRLARDATAPGEAALAAVFERFGDRFRRPDGSLDRAALGRVVFTDPAALRELEAIVHPAVRPRIEAAVAAAEAEAAEIVAIEAIKLVEAGYAQHCDEVWLVTCSPAAQRERLLRRGLSTEDAEARIAAQGDLVSRLRPAATREIDTSGSKDDSRRKVRALREEALAAAAKRRGGGAARP
jgi:dephospho-CoA kinase